MKPPNAPTKSVTKTSRRPSSGARPSGSRPRFPIPLALAGLMIAGAIASGLQGALRFHGNGTSTVSNDPSALSRPVEQAFDAARRGDLDRYLAQFASPLRDNLARRRNETGDDAFRAYLVELSSPIKGLASDLARQEPVGPETIRLPVDFIYTDRNEKQVFTLTQSRGHWLISSIQSTRSAPVLIPYGTPFALIK